MRMYEACEWANVYMHREGVGELELVGSTVIYKSMTSLFF